MAFTIHDFVNNSSEQLLSKYIETYGKAEFVKAIMENKLETVKLLIQHGINFTGNDKWSVEEAGKHGNLEVIKYLLSQGINIYINTNTNHTLIYTIRYHHIDTAKYLIEEGANIFVDNNQSFRLACEKGNTEIVRILIDAGTNVRVGSNIALRSASREGHTEIVRVLVNAGAYIGAEDNQALIYACSRGYLEIVKILVEAGVDIHQNKNEALIKASLYGCTEIVRYLLEKGAKIDERIINNANNSIKEFLINYNKSVYYGICYPTKLDIKLPDLLEIIKDDEYYYVYKLQYAYKGYDLFKLVEKENILLSLNLPFISPMIFTHL